MNPSDIRDTVLRAICAIAPEVDPAGVDDRQPLRDSLDLDSMDFLNVLIALGRDLQVEIPESDYAKLQTLGDLVDYLRSRVA